MRRRPQPGITRSVTRAAVMGVAWVVLVLVAGGTASAKREIRGLATAHLSLRKAEGSTLIETGHVSGAITGSVSARLRTRSKLFTAEYTISTHSGSITGTGQAAPSGTGRYQSFHGTFRTTSGTGLYAHVTGEARLYGVFDRQTESVVVQTVGSLAY